MHLLVRLRSAAAASIIAVLLGAMTLPFGDCAPESRDIRCAAGESSHAAAAGACHTPAADASCSCDDGAGPALATAAGIEHLAMSPARVPGDVVVMAQDRGMTATAILPGCRRPLFTLFSAFLV